MLPGTSGRAARTSGTNYRVYPLQAPALCMPLHSLYMRRSRSARDSSDELRWYVTLLTLFFLAAVSVGALLWPVEFLASVVPGATATHRAAAQAQAVCTMRWRRSRARGAGAADGALVGVYGMAVFRWLARGLVGTVFWIAGALARSNCLEGYNRRVLHGARRTPATLPVAGASKKPWLAASG